MIGQVARQSRYVQGYRVFYRTIGSSWLVQDVESAPEQSTILAELRGNTEYEVKIRPYFNELQGVDSLMVGLRTPEEGEERRRLGGERDRERDRQTERQTVRQRQRGRDTETQRQTERQRDRETERRRDGETERQRETEAETEKVRQRE